MIRTDPQPDPTAGHGDVWREVIAAMPVVMMTGIVLDMVARRRQGLARYGTPLQRDNGRDHWTDAYQEALDLVVYLWAARAPWWMRWVAVLFCVVLRRSVRTPKETP